MQPNIVLEDVSVRYRLPKERVRSIKEFAIQSLLRRLEYEEFWALVNVSFQVAPGEMLGIIGHNGAGKSTVLKLVARVMKPIAGRVRVEGRLAPLIELGAGFDFELTGRENIYLCGSILGISRREMQWRLPEIVEFSELQDFIESPLRAYSTGMVVRLGFAIATACDPDVLLLDEIMAVGDAHFQKKSSRRISEFRGKGATIMFVSHNLAQVQDLCDRVVWLERGRVMAWGQSREVVAAYEAFLQAGNS
jgi:ABC-2 type transport system ATP-binding protein/lipopolysaccharide transport system ATP-binding protein